MENKDLFHKLLDYYQISLDDYNYITRDVDLSSFYGEHHFISGDDTVKVVKKAMEDNDKIIIYGDYDADGIMGCSIVVKLFKMLNYEVSYYIPNRYLDGYGINLEKAKDYVSNGYNLVITVDNGISAFEAISYLKSHNVKVVVLDHHEMQEKLPNADGIMHPIISKFGVTPSSGAFTALFFSIYMLGYVDKYLATLAAISLITDMMPLRSYNRDLFRAVTASYKKQEFLAIDLLLEGNKFDYNSVGMTLGPRINALGRVINDTSINQIVKYFVSDDRDFILNYVSEIIKVNNSRKELTLNALNNIEIKDEKYVIEVLDIKEGLIGLVAGHISNKYNIPAIILTSNDDLTYKASARSPEGFNIFDAFKQLKDLLITFGGHAQAGGFSIEKKNLEQFKISFAKYYESHPLTKVEKKSIDISINDINKDNLFLINTFAPFGETWKAPKLKLSHIRVDSLHNSKNGNAIRTPIGYSTFILGFNMNKDTFSGLNYISCIGSLRESEFMGRSNVEYIIEDWNNN